MTPIKKLPSLISLLLLFCYVGRSTAQNSMTGDGFGGRSWYVPYNYQVGSYTGSTVCAPDSQLYVWGSNNCSQLCNPTLFSSDTAQAIPGMKHIKFSSTGYISAALKSDSTAWVWGGPPGASHFSSTTPQMLLSNVKFLDAGAYHVVFVKNDGTVWGAGYNGSGQLGINTVSGFESAAVQMLGINNAVRAVAVGYGTGYDDPMYAFHGATAILLADRTVKISGGYPWFTPDSTNIPITVPGLTDIIDIKGNCEAVYALNASGEVYSFGSQTVFQNYGVLGIGAFIGGYHAPTKINFPVGAAPIIALSSTDDGLHAFALDENGNVYGWGANGFSEFGIGTVDWNVNLPVLCAGNVIDIHAGETFSYIFKADHTLWAAGSPITATPFMNLPVANYFSWTQLDPTGPYMHLCAPVIFGVLPAKLLDFNAAIRGNTVHLAWQSSMEEDLVNYILEYSGDGIHYKAIATIKAKGVAGNYAWDHVPGTRMAFYRLKMTDNDGRYDYSEVRSVKFGDPAYFTIAPNPVGNEINIYNIPVANIRSIELFSMKGELIKSWNGLTNGQRLDVKAMPTGIYFLKLLTKTGDIKAQKIVKL